MANTNQENKNKPSIDDIKEPYDTDEENSFDAKVMEEEIEIGEIEEPKANVESDYEQSKKFSQGDTTGGNKANSLWFREMVRTTDNLN